MPLKHDPAMRDAARRVYETVYPTGDYAPVSFDQAERYGTVHYRQAVQAAALMRDTFQSDDQRQMALL